MTPRKPHFPTLRNANGGWHQRGKVFNMPKTLDIGYQHLDMCIDKWPELPSQWQLAKKAKISRKFAKKIVMELENTESLIDPEVTNSEAMRDREKSTTWIRRKSSFCWPSVPRNQLVQIVSALLTLPLAMEQLSLPPLSPNG